MEQRTALEMEAAFLGPVDIGAGKVGRQHVGGELQALEVAFQTVRQCLDGAGLGQPGRTFDEQVTIGQQGHQQAFDQAFLAEDLVVEIGAQAVEGSERGGSD